jgi:trk system potassium uptake protein TrkH
MRSNPGVVELFAEPAYDLPVASTVREIAVARLAAARLLGAGAIAVLGQLAVDMPGGYFGEAATVTTFGLVYSVALSIAAIAGAVLLLLGSRTARPVALVVLLIGVAMFLPAVVSDPVIAGGVMLWNLVVLGLSELGRGWDRSPADGLVPVWMDRNGPAVRHLVLVALFVSTLVLGFDVGQRLGAHLVCMVLNLVAVGTSVPMYVRMWHGGSRVPPVVAGVCLATSGAAAFIAGPAVALAVLGGYLVLTLIQLIVRTPLFEELFRHFVRNPGLLLVSSFAILIAVGTVLLSVPAAAADGHRIAAVDALFTATSASCVTGLIVLDTPHAFSAFGLVVILALIQIGGLNIMVLSTFAAVMLGRDLDFRSEAALGTILDLSSPATAFRLTTFIVMATLIVEAAGAVALGFTWLAHGAEPLEALWKGVFHSVSAFCNAGFALQSDSLVMFNRDPAALLVFSLLIVLGGLGFAVLASLWWRARGRPWAGLAVQTRLVIIASAVLIVIGWALYLGLEWQGSLAGLSPTDRVLNALFQSITARTAGFNSVAINGLQPATMLVFMLLMFIGASPGGTGGGIKTTTAAVLVAAIPSIAARRSEVVILNRRIPLVVVFRSASIAVVGLTVALVTAGLLLATHDAPFEWLLFESFSAFGTVGLSLGATSSLDQLGKLVVASAMLAGRVGPLTLALLLGRSRQARVSYPQARIMVG